MWATERLQHIDPASSAGTRHCCPDPAQTAARHSAAPRAAGPALLGQAPVPGNVCPCWKGDSCPLGAFAFQLRTLSSDALGGCSALSPMCSAAMAYANCPLCPHVWEELELHPPRHSSSLSWWCSSSSGHSWTGPLPNRAGAAYWPPTVTLLLFSMTLEGAPIPHVVQVSCSPFCRPVHCRENWAGCSISRPLPVRQIGLELAGGLRSY